MMTKRNAKYWKTFTGAFLIMKKNDSECGRTKEWILLVYITKGNIHKFFLLC